MSGPFVVCLGPTGVGYFSDVTTLPRMDMGVVSDRHGAMLVCDAAIVASVCAQHLPGRVHLITNNLGSVPYEAEAIRKKLEPGVTVHQDPSPFSGAPIDMIFIDREQGTRSFVTTNYYPSAKHMETAASAVHDSLPNPSRVVHYVDVETSSDSGRASLTVCPLLVRDGARSVWNVGQVTRASDVEQWLRDIALPEEAIIQASLGNATIGASELRSMFRSIASAPAQTLVVTLGNNGAAWTDGQTVRVVPAEQVSKPFTLGAGAVLSSSLVLSLADQENLCAGDMVARAVETATRYVRDATSAGNMHGLGFW